MIIHEASTDQYALLDASTLALATDQYALVCCEYRNLSKSMAILLENWTTNTHKCHESCWMGEAGRMWIVSLVFFVLRICLFFWVTFVDSLFFNNHLENTQNLIQEDFWNCVQPIYVIQIYTCKLKIELCIPRTQLTSFFGRLIFHFMGQILQNMGHLGSRFILFTFIYMFLGDDPGIFTLFRQKMSIPSGGQKKPPDGQASCEHEFFQAAIWERESLETRDWLWRQSVTDKVII